MTTSTACAKAELLEKYLTGDLPNHQVLAMKMHLDRCIQCLRRVQEYERINDSSVDINAETFSMASDSVLDDAPKNPGEESVEETYIRPTKSTNPIPGMPRVSYRPGDALGQYKVIEELGRGGMGVVYKAEDPYLQRTAAVKVLGPMLAHDEDARRRFVREAQSAAAVVHENVVTVYEVGGLDSFPFLAMEFVQGESLYEVLIEQKSLPVDEVVRVAVQVAKGLEAAHEQGLVHRDVKPANILMETGTNVAKITDFGLARALDDSSLSKSGEVCGTPHYMAPEQAMGTEIDHRADLFSLGSVLYHLCTGQSPFQASNSMAVLHNVCEEEPKSFAEMTADVPDWLQSIITKLLAKNPDDRYQSAGELVRDLESRRGPGSIVANTKSLPPTMAISTDATRSRGWLYVAMICFVFCAALPAFYLLRPNSNIAANAADNHLPHQTKPDVHPKTEQTPPAKKSQNQPPNNKTPDIRPEAQLPPKAQPKSATGTVRVAITDEKSRPFVLRHGVHLHCSKTNAKRATLFVPDKQYRVPVGDYIVHFDFTPPATTISPRTIRIRAGQVATVRVVLPPPPDGVPPPFR